MAWMLKKRRNNVNCSKFITALLANYSTRELAKAAQVSDRTIRRWAKGEDFPSMSNILIMVENIFPIQNGPSLAKKVADIEPNTNTKTVCVGRYTLAAASNDYQYLRRMIHESR